MLLFLYPAFVELLDGCRVDYHRLIHFGLELVCLIPDLLPILQPADDAEVGPALEKLVDKINTLELYSPWQVSDRSAPRIDPELAQLLESDLFEDRPELEALGPVLKLGGRKFVVHNHYDFSLDPPARTRIHFYSTIIRALTDGTFHKLKKCRECPSFFIADRLTDKFCRPECSQAFFSRDAVNRVRQSRAKHPAKSKKSRRTMQKKSKGSRSRKETRRRESR